MYAIVDIETTGSYAAANGITEICIHVFDGKKVVEKFQTLLNPGQPIPRYIQAFTGITNEMVAKAPAFEKVAGKVHELLHDKIFIAHNVNFDYSFIKAHLKGAGFDLNNKKLCTVRLSRKIFPGFPSYSLGNLCRSLDITIKDRHRAGGDTEATVEVFKLLLENDKEQHIEKSLYRNSKEQALPPNVPKEHFDRLPYSPGVYYFHDEKGKIIYTGKATNLRYRVNSHFSNNSQGRQKQNFLQHTHAISFQPCATELMACILESTEIKKHWPKFNYSQKRPEHSYGIFTFEDRRGYLRLAIDKNKKNLIPVFRFHYLVDGHTILRKLIREFELCPKLCFMQDDDVPCEGMRSAYCKGACEHKEKPARYNKRVQKAIASLEAQPSFAIIEKGIEPGERSFVLVKNGKFSGMGYISSALESVDASLLEKHMTPYKENNFIHNLVNSYATRFPEKVLSL
ncbi:MAG TPA: exonuclease domain-containing protein [Chitinophagaceae bacterium]|nr:exonuclease domain-containing protein [Chitinophagaceae bacterium]